MNSASTPPSVPGLSQQPEPTEGNGLAVTSMVLGILSFLCWLFAAIPAVITGHIALGRASRNEAPRDSKVYAMAGLILGYTNMVLYTGIICVAVLLPALERAREAARRSSCAGNEKQMSIIFKMFAQDSTEGAYPELSPEAGRLMFEPDNAVGGAPVYPGYISNTRILVCPSDAEAERIEAQATLQDDPELLIGDHSYMYLGYVVTNQADLEAFAAAYKLRIQQGLPFNEDLPVPEGHTYSGGGKILRLREGVERSFNTELTHATITADMLSTIPVLWDRAAIQSSVPYSQIIMFNHMPGGSNVLYLDGHVEFVKYPDKFPMTEEALRVLTELDELGGR